MPGVYIHIPFCRQACSYCDFYFTTYFGYSGKLVDALIREIGDRRSVPGAGEIDTVYLGGGTPSALNETALMRILGAVREHHTLSDAAEVTLEVNPDDLSLKKAEGFRAMGINRISMGIQSFRDEDLLLLNRRHDAKTAVKAVGMLLDSGFRNVSIDLIYGFPGLTTGGWEYNLETAFSLGISHLSAYHLSYEPGTVLYYMRETGKVREIEEEGSAGQFELLVSLAADAGFEHYEISSFARNKKYSRHNTACWSGEPYIGIGPSAHSFDGRVRRWNTRGIMTYIKNVEKGSGYFESEEPDRTTRQNEYIMTALRTMWGLDLDKMDREFGDGAGRKLGTKAQAFVKNGNLVHHGNRLLLSDKGKLIADYIIRELFLDPE